jgi:GNAT superfamily N-acetyltransferase
MNEMEIRPLVPSDAEGGFRLSTQAGWNHLVEDWSRTIALSPESCLGLFCDGTLVTTCALTEFGSLGWFGLFLVDTDHRRKGLGTQVFDALLKLGRERGIQRFAMDSSDAGRPIYTRYGFELNEGIERWLGPNGGGAARADLLRESDWDALLELDREVTGIDRGAQLRLLAGEEGARVRVVPEGGFGFTRPGRLAGSIGPVVARDAAIAGVIIDALLADRHELDGERQVVVDLLDNDIAKHLMSERGFTKARRNIRMFLPGSGESVLTGSSVYAATGLGMG